jgi:hypothetical protein
VFIDAVGANAVGANAIETNSAGVAAKTTTAPAAALTFTNSKF